MKDSAKAVASGPYQAEVATYDWRKDCRIDETALGWAVKHPATTNTLSGRCVQASTLRWDGNENARWISRDYAEQAIRNAPPPPGYKEWMGQCAIEGPWKDGDYRIRHVPSNSCWQNGSGKWVPPETSVCGCHYFRTTQQAIVAMFKASAPPVSWKSECIIESAYDEAYGGEFWRILHKPSGLVWKDVGEEWTVRGGQSRGFWFPTEQQARDEYDNHLKPPPVAVLGQGTSETKIPATPTPMKFDGWRVEAKTEKYADGG